MTTLTIFNTPLYIGTSAECREAYADPAKRGRIWLEEEFRLVGLADTEVLRRAVDRKRANVRLVLTVDNLEEGK